MDQLEKPQLPEALRQLYLILGGIRVADKIREAIGSQTMAALQQIQEQKLYLAEGFSNFAEFLNNSPSSPMDKNQYYRLQEFYKAEGPEDFDLLNSVSLPVAKRKLLKAGDVTIEGDQVTVGEASYQISDKKAIRKAIVKAVESFERIEAKSAKAEKDIEKLKKQVEELKAEAENTVPPPPNATDEAAQSLITLLSTFAQLKNHLASLKPAQAKAWITNFRRRVDLAVEDFAIFCNGFVGEDDELTDEELAQIMED